MRRYLFALVLITSVSLLLVAQNVKTAPAQYTSPSSGSEMYKAYCASCHGADGKGGGPAASALKARTPDLTKLSAANRGVFPSDHVAAVIHGRGTSAHGNEQMPVWGPVFMSLDAAQTAAVQQRVHNLTKYIESLQSK